MAKKSTEEIVKEQLKSLPKPVREAIASFDWARVTFDIGRKYDLHVDEIGEVQTEVMLVVLGLISPKDFYDQMVGRVGIDKERAMDVATEVNEKVFIRIREFMKTYYAKEEKSNAERKILNNAGIRLDDGSDLPEEKDKNDNKKDEIVNKKEEEERIVPAPIEVSKKIENLDSKKQNETEKELDIKKDFPDAPANFLDPYREPIE